MAKVIFAVTTCLLALACGGADPSDEGKQGQDTASDGDDYQPPPNANGDDYGNGGPGLPPGWTNWSCPGPGCDPVDELQQIRNAVPDPTLDPAPNSTPPDPRLRGQQTR